MELLLRYERELWIAAVLLYGVGDTASTLFGLHVGGVAEAGPIAAPAIAAFGGTGLFAVKVAVFVTFAAAWRALHTPARVAVPLALATVGGLVTTWNVVATLAAA